ncbi:HNH endonuclease [Streptomyces sp. NPDC057011]|uniref:HNH endonuclease n=1 Tax=unclassified Streptomyces TaxID=2593676 RepID=UPI00363AC57F
MSARNHYTRELLAEAAALCGDIDEVIAYLGTKPYPRLDRYLLERFRRYDIDVTHFARRDLGMPASGSLNETLKRWIREDGLSTAHFLGQAHQRGRAGSTPMRSSADILVKHSGQRRTRTHLLRRALREVGVPECCDTCGAPPEWQGRPMTLEVDHINGDWSDDRQENLRLLCPNCHAVTDTWCRGGPRSR